MKMTIVTDAGGKVIAAVQGHSLSETRDGLKVTVGFPPGHKLHQVEVDDNMGVVSDVGEYMKQLHAYIQP